MPWVASDAIKHTKAANTAKKQRQWAKVANSALKSCLAKDGTEKECDASAIRQANAVVKENEMLDMDSVDVQEVTKTVAGKSRPASDFLVVEDAQKVDTWHLPVKVNGKVDRRLMGAAWAALTAVKGFRGNKYEGPQKASALKKLKALYKSESVPTPDEKAKELAEQYGIDEERIQTAILSEYWDYKTDTYFYVPYKVVSFSDLEAVEKARATAEEIRIATLQFQDLVSNIISNPDIDDRPAKLRALTEEFIGRIDKAAATLGKKTKEADLAETELQESASGAILELLEEQTVPDGGRRASLELEVALLKPGWGNTKDKHYYPADVLKRDAKVFENVKMYTTEHKQEEKNVRTEVAVIRSVTRFLDDGTPVANVVMHDPDFAEATRNRYDAGTLASLECSINGWGKTRRGEIDGRKGRIVEALTKMASVDWVTRAGAGGHALNIQEKEEEGEGEMTNEEKWEKLGVSEEQFKEVFGEDIKFAPELNAEPVVEPEPEPTLDANTVKEVLSNSRLPQLSQERLQERTYAEVDELTGAIGAELEYVKALTDSGKVTDMGGGVPEKSQVDKEAELEEAEDKIFESYGG